MNTSMRETIEQNSDTAANFEWAARLVLKTGAFFLCCSSDPPLKGVMQNLVTPFDEALSGTCNFNVPASQLPGLGELTVEVVISSMALQLLFFQGTNSLGVFSASVKGGPSAQAVTTGKFELGTC